MKKLFLILSLSAGCFAAKAQIPQPDPDTTAKHFLVVASVGNLQEVSAGQLAVQKAKFGGVRSFGQMMVKDHGMAEQQLLQVAKKSNINLPAEATNPVQPDLNLKNAGIKFDQLYVHGMVSAHRNTVQTFERYAVTGKDPNVRAFARQMLPNLKQHLNEVIALEKQL